MLALGNDTLSVLGLRRGFLENRYIFCLLFVPPGIDMDNVLHLPLRRAFFSIDRPRRVGFCLVSASCDSISQKKLVPSILVCLRVYAPDSLSYQYSCKAGILAR